MTRGREVHDASSTLSYWCRNYGFKPFLWGDHGENGQFNIGEMGPDGETEGFELFLVDFPGDRSGEVLLLRVWTFHCRICRST